MEYYKNVGINFSSDIGPGDVPKLVQIVAEKCTPTELNNYTEGRKKVAKRGFSKLAYIMSDVSLCDFGFKEI